jgi:hypothetical protein
MATILRNFSGEVVWRVSTERARHFQTVQTREHIGWPRWLAKPVVTVTALVLPRAALHLFGLIAKRLCMTPRFFRTILILVILFPSVAFADDFKTAGKNTKTAQ